MLGVLMLVRWVPELSRYDAALEGDPVGESDG
jgi:hypothetical protein